MTISDAVGLCVSYLFLVGGCAGQDADAPPPPDTGSSAGGSTAVVETGAETTQGHAFTSGESESAGGDSSTGGLVEIELEDLAVWTRVDAPVLRDASSPDGYEVAADIHVFVDDDAQLRAVYTGSSGEDDYPAIKLARGESHMDWEAGDVVLGAAGSEPSQLNKETSFYRRAASSRHQIYYIGYEDPDVYASQIFRADSDALEGPYTRAADPVVPNGMQAGHDVHLMTSPSIVEHDGAAYMFYCAWNGFPDPTAVWVHAATSDDDGQTWIVVGEVDVPVCMEGALTRGPDGKFYAVAQQDDGFSIGRADEPLGDYELLAAPVLTPAGAPWEVDEMNTPQLFFAPGRAYLYYSGADYATGWWTMLAYAELGS